jgi:ComF family protein
MPALLRLADGVLSVVLAPPCAACGIPLTSPTRGPVCQQCWSSISLFVPPLCSHCGDPLLSWRKSSDDDGRCQRCRQRPSPVTASRAIGPYDGPLRAILHSFKYGGCRSLSRGLGGLLRDSAAEVLAGVDVAVPVPLHRGRRRARGFNQARELARHLGVPVADALRRTRATASQTDLPAEARRGNVQGAFAMRRFIARVNVEGLRVVLVDDVSTTGATIEACATVLRAAGAAEVSAVTAARVVSRPPE